ncbi:glycoside hydrolase family 5 protein [Caulobacter segnis]|uniref:Glycoside hydrolase family 5 domain-containing protein n=1 Tax=Caulobacter segnis TaxID=88688 RepID=A0A2W5V9X2_9CAUL|nr:cellulase family glycosylhydrolase [Caulobacter segnis]PZR32155.1 MAG: hypothetical protein DI526_17395 [Caulobacter segnis]
MTIIARRSAIGLVLAALGLSGARPAPPAPRGPGPRLRRGVNFHHVLNWPQMSAAGDYAWPPFVGGTYETSDAELRRLRASGFDFIRLTVDPAIHLAADAARRAELQDIVAARVKRLIAAGFAVIVDFHPVAQNPQFAPARLMADGDAFAAYMDLAGTTAATLSRLDPSKVVFELFNEPPLWRAEDQPRWQAMQVKLHGVARSAGGAALPLMLTGAKWSSYRTLIALDTQPFQGSNVYYTFHYYEPHIFTHQGVRKEQERYVSNLPWPARPSDEAIAVTEAKALIAKDAQLSADQKLDASRATERLLKAYFDGEGERRNLNSAFAAITSWASAQRISSSRIVMGEFGVAFQPTASPTFRASRSAWLHAVRSAAEAHGFPWAYWAYKGYGGMTLLTDGPSGGFDGEVVKALGLSN